MDETIQRPVIRIIRPGFTSLRMAWVRKVSTIPRLAPSSVSTKVSPSSMRTTSNFEKPRALRMPTSRVRSITMVCMLSRITRKLMTMPRPTMERTKGFSSGKFEELIRLTYSDMDRTRFCGESLRISARVASVLPLLRT